MCSNQVRAAASARLLALTLAAAAPSTASAAGSWAARPLGTLVGRGLVTGTVVWTDPSTRYDRIVQLYEYNGLGYDILTIDPNTGTFTTLSNPSPDSSGVMTNGTDGYVYIGTEPHANVLRFDPKSNVVTNLGRVGTESFVFAIATARDGTIYGGTYPSAQLFAVDRGSARIRLLGRIGPPDDQYAQTLQASDDNRFIYIGVGAAHERIVAFEIATGRQSTIAGSAAAGFGKVVRGGDNAIYGTTSTGTVRLENGAARPVSRVPAAGLPELHDGRIVEPTNTGIDLVENGRHASVPFTYRGRPIPAFRLVKTGPTALYASSILPAYLYRADTTSDAIEQLGYIGGGEVYSFEVRGSMLYMGAYSGAAGTPIFAYDTSRPFRATENPRFIHYPREEKFWRPIASTTAADGNVYFGAEPSYGELGGPLVALNPFALKATELGVPVRTQGVSSLAPYRSLVIGATRTGNVGAQWARGQAEIFFWDTRERRIAYVGVPVPNAAAITDLVIAKDVLVGIADKTVFTFDIEKRAVRSTAPFTAGQPLPNSAALRKDGLVYGASNEGIFRIDPANGRVLLVAHAPQPLTAGFAADAAALYVAAGPTIYRFDDPSRP